jgi:hypothetical protein
MIKPECAQRHENCVRSSVKKPAKTKRAFKDCDTKFPKRNSLPLDDQWLSQAHELTNIFMALSVQYHPGYHAKFTDLQLAITGIYTISIPHHARRPALGHYVHGTENGIC